MGRLFLWRGLVVDHCLVSFGIQQYHPDIKKEGGAQECSQCKFQSRNVRLGKWIGFRLLPGSRRISGRLPPTEQQRALFLDGQCQDAKVKRSGLIV